MHLPLLLLSLATSTRAAPKPTPNKHHPNPPTPYNYIAQAKTDTTHLTKRTVGGVTLSDGVDFTGDVWYGVLPLAECIALNSYAGGLASFQPDEGTECYLYQGKCNDDEDFADLFNDSPEDCDLPAAYPWIGKVESFMCFTQVNNGLSD